MRTGSLSPGELLALHAELVRTPSVSGEEGAAIAFAARFLEGHGLAVERIGGSLLAWTKRSDSAGEAPLVLLDTHLDTVPVAPGWTRDPFGAAIEGERIYGLGANDAKASAAAMVAAVVGFASDNAGIEVALALVREEETKSAGTAEVIAELDRRGRTPAAVVVGEPTGLDLAIAQKGLLVLELVARGEAAHAAHARSLGARNAATALARDLVALEAEEGAERAPLDPLLGRATVTPTLLSGGSARNVVPAEARALLDCRTVPVESAEELRARLAARLEGELVVLSDRLRPVGTDPDSALVRAACRARPSAKLYGSATLSDMSLFAGTPAIKVGPGDSARSHRPDEYVTVAELAEGAAFYGLLLAELAASAREIANSRSVSKVG
jgi:acetylornithine deacetylase